MDLKSKTKFGYWKKITQGEKTKKRNFPLVFVFVFVKVKVSGLPATKSLERFGK